MHLHGCIHNRPGNLIELHSGSLKILCVLRVLCGFHLVLPLSTFNVSAAAACAAARRAVNTRNGEHET